MTTVFLEQVSPSSRLVMQAAGGATCSKMAVVVVWAARPLEVDQTDGSLAPWDHLLCHPTPHGPVLGIPEGPLAVPGHPPGPMLGIPDGPVTAPPLLHRASSTQPATIAIHKDTTHTPQRRACSQQRERHTHTHT